MIDTKELVVVHEVDTGEIRQETSRLQDYSATLQVTDDPTYQQAAECSKKVKSLKKKVEAKFKPTKDAMNKAKSELMSLIKEFTRPLDMLEEELKKRMVTYYRKKEEERLAEQRRLQEEARKVEEERRLNEAIDTGNEKIIDEPMPVPKVQVENTQKVEGVTYVEQVKFEVLDVSKLPREYLIPDTVKIGQVARATKGQIEIPGVRIWVEKQPRIRA